MNCELHKEFILGRVWLGGQQSAKHTDSRAYALWFLPSSLKNSIHLHRVLVHGIHRPRPLESIQQANFTDIVHDALQRSR